MGFFSFGKLLTLVFLLYLFNSLSSFYKIFHLDECNESQTCIYPLFNKEMSFKLKLTGRAAGELEDQHLFTMQNIRLDEPFLKHITFVIPHSIRRNVSYIVNLALSPIASNEPYYDHVVKASFDLTKLKVPDATAFNLLGDESKTQTSVSVAPEIHLYQKIVVTSLSERSIFNYYQIPQEVYSLLKLKRRVDQKLAYLPIVYPNNFMLSDDDLVRVVGQTDNALNISLEFMPVSLGKLRLWRLVEHSTEEMKKFGFNDKNIDSVRGIFTHTNFYLLMITFTVAFLHLLFDILSFKNDISFWRRTKSTQGLSGRTVIWRCVSSVIIFLYLLEEDTSILVLVPFAIGTVLEFWKLIKVFKINISFSGFKLESKDAGEKDTEAFDSQVMKYLMCLIIPLCIAGSIYSLLYQPHKSWYSWTVNTMANGVYVFGFLFMTPQLFINYKLKSVAHLPWKALMYKAFNTFIDDFFAFIITMPTSHRLACFRDDIIFVVYLYQRWLYPVDKSRINEYGHSFEKSTKPDVKKEQ